MFTGEQEFVDQEKSLLMHGHQPNLPKTKSGKIMRRILRKFANNEFNELGDLSTLSEPQAIEEIKNLLLNN
ncbi:acetyl-coenzyme A synthetase [Brachionus plicatilis]|uniref:Acetyl-coenzyme A synthetase n=1 Tax=Brachionus plicatilis TaxID=10195 RepID=A0A3M7SIY6_BRAPC|nr:acetyl-coenzyme A synthetase [Brachionus plicatilis]